MQTSQDAEGKVWAQIVFKAVQAAWRVLCCKHSRVCAMQWPVMC